MKFLCDTKRHLICEPYSIENLHIMAHDLGIRRCWFHKNHYDIPKYMIEEITSKCEVVSPKKIVEIVKYSKILKLMTKLNDVRKWAIVARKHDWHYIIKVTPKNGDDLAVYCKDFDELHKMWHQLNDSSFLKPVDIIRVNHDGTYEEGLEIHNLL